MKKGGRESEKGKKKKTPIKHFLIRQEHVCWGVVGKERACHLSVEQRFKVISECVQTTSPGPVGTWQIWALGFWQGQGHQEFSIKPFQFLRERRGRRLNFLAWLPRVRLMQSRERGDLGEAICESRGRSPKRREGWRSPEHPWTLGRAGSPTKLSKPGLCCSCQNGHWTRRPSVSRPDNESCSWRITHWNTDRTTAPCSALNPGQLHTVHHYPRPFKSSITEKRRERSHFERQHGVVYTLTWT